MLNTSLDIFQMLDLNDRNMVADASGCTHLFFQIRNSPGAQYGDWAGTQREMVAWISDEGQGVAGFPETLGNADGEVGRRFVVPRFLLFAIIIPPMRAIAVMAITPMISHGSWDDGVVGGGCVDTGLANTAKRLK
jgi:hypothetical protein